MKREQDLKVIDAVDAYPRDITRFKTLYPNGEAKLSEPEHACFQFVSSIEMVALVEHA